MDAKRAGQKNLFYKYEHGKRGEKLSYSTETRF